MFLRGATFAILGVATGFGGAARAQSGARQFASGYAGTLPTAARDLARTYFDTPAVRRLIERLESGSVTRPTIDSALVGTGFSSADLVRVKLLRETGGRFAIGFNYFTAADQRLIYAAATRYVPRLIAGYLTQRPRLERIFARYPIPSVPIDRLAYGIIAGMSLNWDGLALGLEQGYRRPDLVIGAGWKYSFWAAEIVPDHSTRGYIWGSTTFPAGGYNYAVDPVDFSFSSFGDPSSDPRMSFPDLLYLSRDALAPRVRSIAAKIGFHDERMFGSELHDVLGLELGRSTAAILFALRQGPASEDALRAVIPADGKPRVADLLTLLEEIQSISRDGAGRYQLTMPVLDRADAELTAEALAVSRGVIADWLAESYQPIRTELAGLTALRQGVAYESLFTQIWHELFGLATRELAAAGLIADPYGGSVRYPGSLAMLWRMSLYHFDPQ
jgi:hypothetical protein